MNAILSPLLRGPGPCPTVHTKRLVLRPHRTSDADAIAESLGDFEVARMLSRVPLPYDRQDALDGLATAASTSLPGWNLAITTGDDVHIGVVAIELRHGQWHLGYWLNRYFWGRGFMSEAASAVVERFFRRMPDEMLHSGAFADNGASLRIQDRLGFAITGRGDLYSRSRGAMAPHITTRLGQPEFRPILAA
ncbi:GNAT family N-acetyltransferase [Ciceribacter sp. L1K22]|uniref:GNAT family N-acetyltransferase n=1 Tax=Ciceribacter sp. L1K22 TaxID=2820275 RepID=UPI001ABE0E85|nr:GNAT family N-acetyltransferase [Ciceribacter sp. L1K22]MBO3758159.1 GNAT family N-acetyltransferase [Ciceribacter sp. L1K22]